jgi:hypothetical protein
MYLWKFEGVVGGKDRVILAVGHREGAMPDPNTALRKVGGQLGTHGWERLKGATCLGDLPAAWDAEDPETQKLLRGGPVPGAPA